MKEDLEILIAIGRKMPKSLTISDDGDYDYTPEEMKELGRKFAKFMMWDTPCNFCDGFAEGWRDWHINYCKKHHKGYSYCRQNLLGNCANCNEKFICYTECKI